MFVLKSFMLHVIGHGTSASNLYPYHDRAGGMAMIEVPDSDLTGFYRCVHVP